VRELLGGVTSELECTTTSVRQRFPSTEFFADFFLTHYGPTLKAGERLSEDGRRRFCDDRRHVMTAAGRLREARRSADFLPPGVLHQQPARCAAKRPRATA
jgi:hypothetical protein